MKPEILPARLIVMLAILLLTGCATMDQTSKSDESQPASSTTASNSDPFAIAELADSAYAKSQWLEAQRHYKTLSELVPDDAYAWFRLGNTHIRQGEVTQATHAFEEALRRDPQYPKAWYNLATAHLLNAQHALRQTYHNLRPEDPGRLLAQQRLHALDQLIYQRLEEPESPAAAQSALPQPVQPKGNISHADSRYPK